MIEKIKMDDLITLVEDAGRLIRDVAADGNITVEYKDDESPLTRADKVSHEYLLKGLKGLYADVPVFSEESSDVSWKTRKDWDSFWLVDPLDGTKGFIDGSGEYTVNVALIHKGEPIMGVIHVPVDGRVFYASRGGGAWKTGSDGKRIRLSTISTDDISSISVVVSRHHRSESLDKLVVNLGDKYESVNVLSFASSLKFCAVAEGLAHLYPRLGPTCEWDTGAGQAIVEEAGGVVIEMGRAEPLRYNKQDPKNGAFLVCPSYMEDEVSTFLAFQ